MKIKFNDFINESYDISEDDYRYFRGYLDDEGKYVKSIKERRNDWERMMLASCKTHWGIGDGDPKKFPMEEMKKVIKEVLDDYLKKFDEQTDKRKPLTFKTKNNELFFITFKFDNEGRLDKVSNKWDVKFPDWWGLNVSDNEIIDYFRKKYPEYYVDK